MRSLNMGAIGAALLLCGAAFAAANAAWEPTRPVEFIVPAGTGGGADQMARIIQGIVTKHNLMKQSMVVINKAGGAGGEGFLDVKSSTRQPAQAHHHAVEPVHHAARHRHSVQLEGHHAGRDDGARRVRALGQRRDALQDRQGLHRRGQGRATAQFKMGGTGSKQEDQIITVAIEKATGAKFTYIPYKGGGEVAVQLVGNHVDSTVNNPIEAVAQWRAGKLRPLCVFDAKPLRYKDKIAGDMAWNDIPTCKSAGPRRRIPDAARHLHAARRHARIRSHYYVELFKKVRETPEWKKLMEDGAFNQTFMTGEEYRRLGGEGREAPRDLMKEAGFLAELTRADTRRRSRPPAMHAR